MNRNQRTSRRGFSLIEVLISLTITGTLLAATMAALDASFKSYKATTEGASTHVVSRMVMNRIMAMLRTGTQFGPYPNDVLDNTQNPVTSTFVEFLASDDGAGHQRIVRIERRDATSAANGPFELWYRQVDMTNGTQTAADERPLITGVTEASFILEYDVGPRLRRATVDLTIRPNDYQDARIGVNFEAPTIRLVSSTMPRRLLD